MAGTTEDPVRQLYDQASGLPVEDRIALVQMLFGTLRQDVGANGSNSNANPSQTIGIGGHVINHEEFIPRGVPVERTLARSVPTVIDDAGIDELRWQHLAEKYLK